MNRKYRKTVIVGNWKMNKTVSETRAFIETLRGSLPRSKRCSVVLCVPYVDIPLAVRMLKDSRIAVGAQNIHRDDGGSSTGEISAAMLADLDVRYVIVGHKDRRSRYLETDWDVNRKLRAALDAGLRPILCIGEDREQRELGVTEELLVYRIRASLSGVAPEEIRRIVIAYQPMWVDDDDTKNALSPEQVGEACSFIRGVLRRMYGARIARSTTIQYGGPMDDGNAEALLSQEDVDGGLIGSASLSTERFLSIIETANRD